MIYPSRAIVLRTVRYGETSLITDMYTEEKGHQTFIIHSVRKAKATTPPSYLQVLSLLDIVGYHKDQQKIHHIKEVRLEYPYQSIPFDRRKSAVITCLAEICAKCITTADPQPDLFHFMHEALIHYDEPDSYDRDFMIRFLAGLSHFLGFGIDLSWPHMDKGYFDLLNGHFSMAKPSHAYWIFPEEYNSLARLIQSDPSHPEPAALDIRRKAVDQLVLYYQLHVESLHEINSLKILRELF